MNSYDLCLSDHYTADCIMWLAVYALFYIALVAIPITAYLLWKHHKKGERCLRCRIILTISIVFVVGTLGYVQYFNYRSDQLFQQQMRSYDWETKALYVIPSTSSPAIQ